MRILFVAMSDSIHTARWINQLDGQGWDIHLFPSIDVGIVRPELKHTTVHHSIYQVQNNIDKSVKSRGFPVAIPGISKELVYVGNNTLERLKPHNRLSRLHKLIKKLRPDIIHSMEIQAGGYLVSELNKQFSGQFPAWIVTNWGSDIYLFGRLEGHKDKIKDVLAGCDYYSCECQRDVMLAREFGFKGKVLPVLPNSGGFDIEKLAQFKQPGPVSDRRLILLKGYQHWSGRALVGLRALELCADSLKGYRIGIPLATKDVVIAAELVSHATGIPIDIIPRCPHDEMMRLYGQARVSISLSISDAINTSLLEAMVMGAFPIQSCTACADEWINDGETGLVVPPEDSTTIAAAIRKAVSDDKLVNRAAELNAEVVRERLASDVIRPQVIEIYRRILRDGLSS